MQINGGTVTLGEDDYKNQGAGIFIIKGGSLTISGGIVTATSQKDMGIHTREYEFSSGITVETWSPGKGDDKDYPIYYPGAKVTAGNNKENATVLTTQADREGAYKNKDYKYILIEPCSHEGSVDANNRCALCGAQLGQVRYIEREWDGGKVVSTAKDVPEACIAITSKDAGAELDGGWYLIDDDVEVDGRVSFKGDTNLILCDGFTLDVEGLYIPSGNTLTIYGQSKDTGRLVSRPSDGAGIGGKSGSDSGNIVIHGGTIDVRGGDHCAAIGTNDGKTGGDITIYGGTVAAKGGSDGAAIGGGKNSSGGVITIYDGNITTSDDPNEDGAGIGGGLNGDGGTITIWGGTVTTWSRDGAGIGNGADGSGSTITLDYTDHSRDSIAVKANSYSTPVTFIKAFLADSSYIAPGTFEQTELLANKTLRASGRQPVEVAYQDLNDETRTELCFIVDKNDTILSGTWYAITDSFSIDHEVSVSGDVNLILADGCIVNTKTIQVAAGNSLTIWGQVNGSGTLKATAADEGKAGIGGALCDCGTITINGGTVNATGNNGGAGIGANENHRPGTVIINGGTVTATGGYSAAGIGGGFMNVFDAKTNTNEGRIEIHGGTVKAYGQGGSAGIGSGYHAAKKSHTEFDTVGTILITGGTVTAKGSRCDNDWVEDPDVHGAPMYIIYPGFAAAIGGGYNCKAGDITITGGTVNAIGYQNGAGIGTGSGHESRKATVNGGTITITGGTVNASTGYDSHGSHIGTDPMGAAIGGSYRGGGVTINISGGVVNATAGKNGSSVGASFGSGKYGKTSNVTLDWTESSKKNMVVAPTGSYNSKLKFEKPFKDEEGTIYIVASTESELKELAGKKLVPWYSTYTVTFLPGDDTAIGTMKAEDVEADTFYTMPACGFVVADKVFRAWYVQIGNNWTDTVAPGKKILVWGNTTATALWKEDAGVAITGGDRTVDFGETGVTLEATVANPGTNGALTWQSSNETVATIDNTGAVTVVKPGETTITAKYESDETIGEAKITLTIGPKSIAGAIVELSETRLSYDGTEKTVAVTGVTLDGVALDAKDYEATGGTTGTDAGTYTATVKGVGNYKDTANATWQILPGAITATAEDVTVVYDGAGHGISAIVTTPASGYTVKYGLSEDTCNRDESPTQTTVAGSPLTVYFRVSAPNYEDMTGNATVKVNRRSVTVRAQDQTVPLNGSIATGAGAATLTGAVSGHVLNKVTLTDSGTSSATDSGTITPSGAGMVDADGKKVTGNYNINYEDGTLTVTRAHIYIASGVAAGDKTYDGGTTATVTGTAVFKTISDDTEVSGLTVSDIAATFASKNAGTGKAVAITGAVLSDTDNYWLSIAKSNQALGLTANITAKPVTVSGVTAAARKYEAGNLNVTLSGGTVNGVLDGDTVDVDLSAATGTMADANVGTDKAVTVSGAALTGADAGNYALSEQPEDVTVNITPKSISGATVAFAASEITYDGTQKTVTVAGVTLDGVALGAGDYDVSGDTTGTDVGTYTVTVTGVGNYKDTATGTWEIVPKPVTITGLGAANKTYDGKTDATVTGTAVIDGKADGDDVSVSAGVAAFDDANAGTGKTVTFSGYSLAGSKAKNYRLSAQPASVKTDITAKEISLSWSNTSFTYDGKNHVPTATATGLVAGDTCAVTVTGAQTDAGSYTATASGLSNANYALPESNTRTFTIGRRTVGLSWSNTSFTYEGKSHAPTAKATRLIAGDTCAVTVTGAQIDAGSYIATASGLSNANYALPVSNTRAFTIMRAKVTVSAVSKRKTYGAPDPTLTAKVTGLKNGDAASVIRYSLSRAAGEDAGRYTITPEGKTTQGNYSVVYRTGTLTIVPKTVDEESGNLGIKLKLNDSTYDGKAKRPTVTVTEEDAPNALRANSSRVIPASEYTVTYENNLNAGTAKVVITDKPGGNYVVNGSATFTIEKRKVTVTAADQTVEAGESIQTGAEQAKLEGQVQGHTLKRVKLTATSTAKATVKGKITPSAAVIVDARGRDVTKNYSITYAAGRLTVKDDRKPAESDYTLLAQMKACGQKALRVTWTKVEGADGYDVYFMKDDPGFSKADVVSVTNALTCKFEGLKKNTAYKAYVEAWKLENGRKNAIGKASPVVSALTGNGNKKWTNAESVKVKVPELSLRVGKKATIKATVKGVDHNKKVLKQDDRLLRYYSSNRNVARVTSDGTVKAVGKGTCTVWVVAANGKRFGVKVKVK